jgi:hypothetical protein
VQSPEFQLHYHKKKKSNPSPLLTLPLHTNNRALAVRRNHQRKYFRTFLYITREGVTMNHGNDIKRIS